MQVARSVPIIGSSTTGPLANQVRFSGSNAPQNKAPKPMSEFVESIVLDTSARENTTRLMESLNSLVLRRFLDGRVVQFG